MVTGQQYVVMFMLGRAAESAADSPVSGTVARLYTGTERAAYGGFSSESPEAAMVSTVAAATTKTGALGDRHDREVVTLSNLIHFVPVVVVVVVVEALHEVILVPTPRPSRRAATR